MMRTILPMVVWVCLKCGVIHHTSHTTCPLCHGNTRKEVLSEDYWEDKYERPPSC